ncbi:MAG: VWA domain-containing protein [Bdellovibrionota bacterium]
MRFANSEAFQLLWLLPIIWLASIAFEARSRKLITKALGEKLTPFLSASVSKARRRVRFVLVLLSMTSFIFALARPQAGESLQEVKVQGIELVIAIDVSNSMLAEDVKPSRLQHAKSEMTRLLDLLSGDKVGLIAFAGSAVLISPLTTDKSSLKMFIDSMSTESVESQGTNVQKALAEARAAFERGGVDDDDASRVTRVILVISDGEDQEKNAIAEAKKLTDDGTRIFTLAFGTERGAQIPIRDERGFLREFKRDRSGQPVVSRVDGKFLRQLAEVGNGAFHHATFGGEEAKLIKNDLDKLQKSEFSSSLATNYDERFQIPLLLGLVFALLSFLIGERRAAGRLWKGRFEVAES